MGFFDVPPPPPPPPQPKPTRKGQPDWAGAPPGVLPGLSNQRVVLFHTREVLLMVYRFEVFATGVDFRLNLRLREEDETGHPHPPWEVQRRGLPHPLPDDFLRFGMLFSDGTKWTNLDWRERRSGETPTPPVVMARGGGGGGGSWNYRYWMWPLPPAGDLTVVTQWPVHGIPETRATIDATELRDRASEAKQIWPS